MQRLSSYFLLLILVITFTASCGGNSTNPGSQFTLNVEGNIAIGNAGSFIQGKAGAGTNVEQQVFIGTAIIEVQENFTQEIGVNLIELNVTAQTQSAGEIRLSITPQTNNEGILFKRDEFGVPFGASLIDINTTVEIPEGTPELIELGQLNFVANNPNEPSRLPLLNQIPVISFLFANENKEASITELIIIMTPELIETLD